MSLLRCYIVLLLTSITRGVVYIWNFADWLFDFLGVGFVGVPRLQNLNSQSASTKTMPHGKHQNLCQMQVHTDQNRQLSTGNTTTTITTTILLRCNLQFVDVYITVQFGLWLRLIAGIQKLHCSWSGVCDPKWNWSHQWGLNSWPPICQDHNQLLDRRSATELWRLALAVQLTTTIIVTPAWARY